MDKPALYLLRATDAREHQQEFSHPWNAASQVIGSSLSRAVGLKRSGVNLLRVPAGKESFAYHSHRFEEEWIYVLEGRGIARVDGAECDVGPGDFLGFPTPSVAHLMRNPGPGDLVYLSGGEHREFEIAEFPDLRKRMVRVGNDLQIYDFDDAKPFAAP
jgi:uncharacterized cupin superfamily protein